MIKLLHITDSYLGAAPFRSTRRAEEVWSGFEQAVDAAIRHGAGILLHTGSLVSEFDLVPSVYDRIRATFDRAVRANVAVVVLQDGDIDLATLDVDVVAPGGEPVLANGAWIAAPAGPEAPPWPAGDAPHILAMRVGIIGMPALERNLSMVEPRQMLGIDAHYVALGGARQAQPVQANAWYAGQTARLDLLDTARAGGLLVEIAGGDTRIRRVTWPDRAHRRLLVDGAGLDAPALDALLVRRVRELAAARSPGDVAHLDPVLHVTIRDATGAIGDSALPDVLAQVTAYAQVDWSGQRHFIQGTLED